MRQLATLSQRLSTADESTVPVEAREALQCIFRHIDALTEKLGEMEARIVAWHKSSPESQRLASAPGVGPITATAIVAAVGDGTQFRSSRHFAAWIGLAPRIKASGGKERIGRITKGGDRCLRTLLIHGARAVVGTTFRKDVAPRPWLILTRTMADSALRIWGLKLKEKIGFKRAAIAIARKLAVIMHTMLKSDDPVPDKRL